MDLGTTLCVAREPQCARARSPPIALRGRNRVDEFPGRRARRARPSRRIAMLGIRAAGVLLEDARPAASEVVWSLPEGDARPGRRSA
jgi:adenine-specific DNA glycosylase